MKASVFIATSLDGFIARPDGEIDWLMDPRYDIEGEDFGFYDYIATVDAIIMGRNSFDKVLTFGSWHYTKPVIVLTSRPLKIPEHLSGKAFVSSGTVPEILKEMEDKGYRHLYIDGGITIRRFLDAGVINELTITLIPVLIGDGIPLFGALDSDIKLSHKSTVSYKTGLVQNTYAVEP